MEHTEVFRAEKITKEYPGVRALDNVSLDLRRGEVLALLGENGAGKSTLINVMSGVCQPDGGKLYLDGEPISFPSPRDAFDAGIAVVHQELNYVSPLTIAENVMMSRHPLTKTGFVDWNRMYEESISIMDEIDLKLDPHMIMGRCTVAQKQQIEIAKAMYWKARILILDEPTSALNDVEIRNLMDYLRKVRAAGVAVVYISHKIGEILEIADRVGVLRDGRHVRTLTVAETAADELISLMVGRSLSNMYPKQNTRFGSIVLQARGLTNDAITDVSFDLRQGEILGVYGLMGSGHTELGPLLFGENPATAGSLELNGEVIKVRSPADALRAGMAYVPSERKSEGLVLSHTVQENIVSVSYVKGSAAFVDRTMERRATNRWIDQIRIKTPSGDSEVRTLSGGNQQKVVLAKWMEVQPKVLIMIDPTRGIDVGSKAEIYRLLDEFCASGISVVMITSEMPELLAMSDRVLVMREGKISEFFKDRNISQVDVATAAIGSA